MMFTRDWKVLRNISNLFYRADTVLLAAEHAIAAYQPVDEYKDTLTRAGYNGGMLVNKTSQVGIAWVNDEHPLIIISVRGSSEGSDWVDDALSIMRVHWPEIITSKYATVGLGFKRHALNVCGPVYEEITAIHRMVHRKTKKDMPVVVTGHSLGAAIVPLVMAWLRAHGISQTVGFAFESPRVGNASFANWFDVNFTNDASPLFSIVNTVDGVPDIVTRIPKRSWGFRHCGKRYILDGDRVLSGARTWRLYRGSNPVSSRTAAWRIITRSTHAVRAHLGMELLKKLRSMS